MQSTPYFNQKISLGQLTQNRTLFCSQESAPVQNNHITWEDASNKQWQHQSNKKNSNGTHVRRRIFDKFQSKLEHWVKNMERSHSKSKQNGTLKKVKSNPHVTFQQMSEDMQPDARISQINRQLRQHRENLTSSRTSYRNTQTIKNQQEPIIWAKIQQNITQSKQILKRQEEILATKIPTFQKKIEDNNVAINQVTKLIRLKLQNQNKKVEDLYHKMQKNQDRIRTREQQLSRINSELLLKQSQIMRNKEINKRRQIELQRIKRIQDLQNKNIEIYHQIEKKDQLSQFQDYPIQGEQWVNHEECWGECDSVEKLSKISVNKISTIQYSEQNMYNPSDNQTIGQLLSPLALMQNQYLV